jgi:hypothetical protein
MLPLMRVPFQFKPQLKPKPRFPNDRKRFPSQKPKTPPCLWVKCPTCGNDAYPLHGFCHEDHFPMAGSRKELEAGVYKYRCFGNMHRFLAPKESIPRFRAEHAKH